MRVTALLGFLIGAALLLILEAAIWLAPVRRGFSLTGHLMAQAGLVAVLGVAVLLRATFEADGSVPQAHVRWGHTSRALRRAQLATELAELRAREARALAEREAALLGRDAA